MDSLALKYTLNELMSRTGVTPRDFDGLVIPHYQTIYRFLASTKECRRQLEFTCELLILFLKDVLAIGILPLRSGNSQKKHRTSFVREAFVYWEQHDRTLEGFKDSTIN